jgi:hypothetical protein
MRRRMVSIWDLLSREDIKYLLRINLSQGSVRPRCKLSWRNHLMKESLLQINWYWARKLYLSQITIHRHSLQWSPNGWKYSKITIQSSSIHNHFNTNLMAMFLSKHLSRLSSLTCIRMQTLAWTIDVCLTCLQLMKFKTKIQTQTLFLMRMWTSAWRISTLPWMNANSWATFWWPQSFSGIQRSQTDATSLICLTEKASLDQNSSILTVTMPIKQLKWL